MSTLSKLLGWHHIELVREAGFARHDKHWTVSLAQGIGVPAWRQLIPVLGEEGGVRVYSKDCVKSMLVADAGLGSCLAGVPRAGSQNQKELLGMSCKQSWLRF